MPVSRSNGTRRPARIGNWVALESSSDGSHFEVDLDAFGLAPELTSNLAEIFAVQMSRRGSWRTAHTCRNQVWTVERLARMLESDQLLLKRLSDFSPVHYAAYELATTPKSALRLKAILRRWHSFTPEMQDVLDRRTRKSQADHDDIGHEEAARLSRQLDLVLRRAYSRMQPYFGLLDADEALTADDGRTDVEGAKRHYLRHLIGAKAVRRAAVPEYRAYVAACRAAGEPAQNPWPLQNLVMLKKWECDALILRIILEFGWNLTTVLELELPYEQRNPHKPGSGTYTLKLVKRRRFANAVEHRTLPLIDKERSTDLLTLAIKLTRLARAGTSDGPMATRMFLHGAVLASQGITVPTHFGAQVLAKNLQLAYRAISPKRIRRYVNTLDRRAPNQNTQDTHDRDYVATSIPVKKRALDIIEAGANDALNQAEVFYENMLRDGGDTMDTVGAGCVDTTHGPFTRNGSTCKAPLLWCFSCPNARIAPRHFPVVTAVRDSLIARQTLPGDDEQMALASIENLKSMHLTAAQWKQARENRTPQDEELVELLLTGALNA
jgi:hypothetical protein